MHWCSSHEIITDFIRHHFLWEIIVPGVVFHFFDTIKLVPKHSNFFVIRWHRWLTRLWVVLVRVTEATVRSPDRLRQQVGERNRQDSSTGLKVQDSVRVVLLLNGISNRYDDMSYVLHERYIIMFHVIRMRGWVLLYFDVHEDHYAKMTDSPPTTFQEILHIYLQSQSPLPKTRLCWNRLAAKKTNEIRSIVVDNVIFP